MIVISISEAKSHFSKLIRDVENGETVIITRRGIAVARIVPIQSDSGKASIAVDELLRFTQEHDIRLGSDITIRELIEEGRE